MTLPEDAAYDSLLMAHPSFDLWSAGAVLCRLLSHQPLLEADDRDNVRGERKLRRLADWVPADLTHLFDDTLGAMRLDSVDDARERFAALELLCWLLQRNPASRPSSCNDALQHPFFIPGQAGQFRMPECM